MLGRFVNWLLGTPKPEDLEARRHRDAERDHEKDRQVEEMARSSMVGKGPGPAPHDWPRG